MKDIVRRNPLMTTYTQHGSYQGQKGQIDNYAAAAWNFIIENICLWCWFWWGSLGLGSYGFGLRQWLLMVSLKVSMWPVVFAWGSVVMAQLDFWQMVVLGVLNSHEGRGFSWVAPIGDLHLSGWWYCCSARCWGFGTGVEFFMNLFFIEKR